jgi:hypothetical protein
LNGKLWQDRSVYKIRGNPKPVVSKEKKVIDFDSLKKGSVLKLKREALDLENEKLKQSNETYGSNNEMLQNSYLILTRDPSFHHPGGRTDQYLIYYVPFEEKNENLVSEYREMAGVVNSNAAGGTVPGYFEYTVVKNIALIAKLNLVLSMKPYKKREI